LYDPIKKKIIINRDVIFEEDGKWNWNLNPAETTLDAHDWSND